MQKITSRLAQRQKFSIRAEIETQIPVSLLSAFSINSLSLSQISENTIFTQSVKTYVILNPAHFGMGLLLCYFEKTGMVTSFIFRMRLKKMSAGIKGVGK